MTTDFTAQLLTSAVDDTILYQFIKILERLSNPIGGMGKLSHAVRTCISVTMMPRSGAGFAQLFTAKIVWPVAGP